MTGGDGSGCTHGKIPSTLVWRLLSGSPGTPGVRLKGIISGCMTLSTQPRTQDYI
ncbi:hypothetical protein CSC26_6545 [Pseudomonas aeruginosa]|nr:hypothetical protein CSC26_6545 [Pseudomonas aeruginosa]AXA06415.1 hypothetical protein CSC44_2416 [Pseudomonas aeruginosa]RAL81120.1 hypothetical protein CSC34_4182 [Pseudomonas aeruginosa]